jgi:hypothetical protein
VPWSVLEQPPALARGAKGWVAAFAPEKGADARAVLWREHGRAEVLARGDGLTVRDASCAADACAVLTTLVTKVASPGASVFWGSLAASAADWRQADIRAKGKSRMAPLSILHAESDSVSVGLTDGRFVQVWDVAQPQPDRRQRLRTGPRIYDVLTGDAPLVVHAGEPVVTPCRKHGFRVAIQSASHTELLTVPAPPERAALRRTGSGLFLAWLAPASCRHPHTPLVHGAQLSGTGRIASAPMAVGYADDFAISTAGNRVHIWLRQGRRLLWARARCHADKAVAPRTAASTSFH